MEQKELIKWDFEKELKKMAVSCIGLKEKTAESKASNIFKKYDEIISYSKGDRDYYKDEYVKYNKMFNAIKSGIIEYVSSDGKKKGSVSIKNIEQIEVFEGYVLITMAGGREVTLGSDFKYIKELL